MLRHLLVFVVFVAVTNAQDFHGGSMSYEVMRTNTDDVIIRYHHRFLLIYKTNEKDAFSTICTKNCGSGKIPADELRYRRPNATKDEIKSFNASFYCDSFNSNENLLSGSLRTDVSLSRKYDTYDFTYLSTCCDYPDTTATSEVKPTFKPAKFALTADLKIRNATGMPNNPPDTSSAPIYIELKFGTTNNTKKLVFPDKDGDIVRCEFSSKTCAGTASVCNSFTLTDDCTLTLAQTVAFSKYSIGILVKDFAANSTVFTTPYSTVPFYMVVKVLSPIENNPTPYECKESRQIQNQLVGASTMNTVSLSVFLFSAIFYSVSSTL